MHVIWLHVWICSHVHRYVWRLEVDVWRLPWLLSTLYIQAKSLSVTQNSELKPCVWSFIYLITILGTFSFVSCLSPIYGKLLFTFFVYFSSGLSFCCWIVDGLCIFWIRSAYQTHRLQIPSPNSTDEHFALFIGTQEPSLKGCFDAHASPQQVFVVTTLSSSSFEMLCLLWMISVSWLSCQHCFIEAVHFNILWGSEICLCVHSFFWDSVLLTN